jgi:hypothetical protein
MYDGQIEFLATIEHANRINDPHLTRRAQIGRELALIAGADVRHAGGPLLRLNQALGRIGALFALPRPAAERA